MDAATLEPIVGAVATIFAAGVMYLGRRLVVAYEIRAHVELTEQQRKAVLGAIDTAAGLLKVEIQKGGLALADLHPDAPAVRLATNAALDNVPAAATALGVTAGGAATIAVGKVGNTLPPPPATEDPCK